MMVTKLNKEKLYRAILRKLKSIDKPQTYLSKKQGFCKDSIQRLRKGKEPRMYIFFNMVDWLDEEPQKFIIRKRTRNPT